MVVFSEEIIEIRFPKSKEKDNIPLHFVLSIRIKETYTKRNRNKYQEKENLPSRSREVAHTDKSILNVLRVGFWISLVKRKASFTAF